MQKTQSNLHGLRVEKIEKIYSYATITIDYGEPSIKGRTIGKNLEPLPGKVWRTGANEATVFETDKDLMIEGQMLPAGKYSLFTIANDEEWTIIFNEKWKQWGAYKYKETEDVLRVKIPVSKNIKFSEKLAINVSKEGKFSIIWGDVSVAFYLDMLYPKLEDFNLVGSIPFHYSDSTWNRIERGLSENRIRIKPEFHNGQEYKITQYIDLELENYPNKGVIAFLIFKPINENRIMFKTLVKKRYYTYPENVYPPDNLIVGKSKTYEEKFIKLLGL